MISGGSWVSAGVVAPSKTKMVQSSLGMGFSPVLLFASARFWLLPIIVERPRVARIHGSETEVLFHASSLPSGYHLDDGEEPGHGGDNSTGLEP